MSSGVKDRGFSPDHNAYLVAAEADPYLASVDPRMASTLLLPEGGRYGDIGVAGARANEDQTVMVQRADRSWLKVELHKLTKEERDAITLACSPTQGNPASAMEIYEKYAEAIAAKEKAKLHPAADAGPTPVQQNDPGSEENMNRFFEQVSKRQETPVVYADAARGREQPKKKAVFKGSGWTMRGTYDDIIVGEYAIVFVFGSDDSNTVFLPAMESADEAYDFTLKVDGFDTLFVLNSSSVQFDYAGKTFAVFPILER